MIKKKNILFVTPGKNTPSSIYRVQQFVPYFRNKGYSCIIKHAKPNVYWHFKYEGKNKILKYLIKLVNEKFRLPFILKLFNRLLLLPYIFYCNIIFFQRPIIKDTLSFIENFVHLINKNIIFDFDDAIFLNNEKTISNIIGDSKEVIVGNKYLANFVYSYKKNENVHIIPTCVDINKIEPKKNYKEKKKL